VLTNPHRSRLFECEVEDFYYKMLVGADVAAEAHGETVIEEHFTLICADGGVDSAFSLELGEMKQLVIERERAWQSLGNVTYRPNEAEQPTLKFRRSLYIAKDMTAGDELTSESL
jgi:sialic acid synthase SpsE